MMSLICLPFGQTKAAAAASPQDEKAGRRLCNTNIRHDRTLIALILKTPTVPTRFLFLVDSQIKRSTSFVLAQIVFI